MNKHVPLKINVYADWAGLNGPACMGALHATVSRGKEIFSFEYDKDWLKNSKAHNLDPSLQFFSGPQYPSQGQENFGLFLDSAPDRWGRFLMDRREAQMAKMEGRKERKLLESDYLLGVYDEHRAGALRFRTDPDGPFLYNKEKASPPWTSLRELEYISLQLEKNNAEKNPQYSKWLQMLVAPGSSLGGSRPKASVVDENKHLWVAKFPSGNDSYDMGAWEMVVNNLAKKAKIATAESQIHKFNVSHHTFLSKRFDRSSKNDRIHFASALTLLQRRDGDDFMSGASYLELAEFIIQQGNRTTHDLEQLWRRIVFSICVSNVDDHLRNHGFILQANGWALSPAYDINPNAQGNGLKLNISDSDNSQDLSLAKDVAVYFRLNNKKADLIIKEIVTVVKSWRKAATAIGLSTKEQNTMASAFRIADATT